VRTALIVLVVGIPSIMFVMLFVLALCRSASVGDRQLHRAYEAECRRAEREKSA
jgi:hypothetical protein